MPHVKTIKAGQRVIVREERGDMWLEGLKIGMTGTVRLAPDGAFGVEFDHDPTTMHIRYQDGQGCFSILGCCDVLETAPECPESRDLRNPWDDFWAVAEKHRDAYFFAESRGFTLTNDGLQILRVLDHLESGSRAL